MTGRHWTEEPMSDKNAISEKGNPQGMKIDCDEVRVLKSVRIEPGR